MAAITAMMELFRPGDHIITDADLYGGCIRLFDHVSEKNGIIFSHIDCTKEVRKHLDFDTVIERKQTDYLKYDFAIQRGMPEDILPLWVADMDFQTSSLVLDAIKTRVDHGIFGYTESQSSYFEAVAGWMKEK